MSISSNVITNAQSGDSAYDVERLPLHTEMANPARANTHADDARSTLKLLRIRNMGKVIVGYLNIIILFETNLMLSKKLRQKHGYIDDCRNKNRCYFSHKEICHRGICNSPLIR